MRLRGVVLFGVSCLALAVGATADAVAQKPIEKADGCGFVVDQTGQPVADATLTASSGDFKMTVTSTGDGSFLFSGTSNRPMLMDASAAGFAKAQGTVAHLEAASEKKCKRPIYVVLLAGGGESFLTMKKKDVPQPAKQPNVRRGR